MHRCSSKGVVDVEMTAVSKIWLGELRSRTLHVKMSKTDHSNPTKTDVRRMASRRPSQTTPLRLVRMQICMDPYASCIYASFRASLRPSPTCTRPGSQAHFTESCSDISGEYWSRTCCNTHPYTAALCIASSFARRPVPIPTLMDSSAPPSGIS
jgi:hypothetical protein